VRQAGGRVHGLHTDMALHQRREPSGGAQNAGGRHWPSSSTSASSRASWGEVIGAQVLEPRAVPGLAQPRRSDHQAGMHLFSAHADPSRAISGDAVGVETIGLEFHGAVRGSTCNGAGAWGGGNCGQIIGFATCPWPVGGPMPPELKRMKTVLKSTKLNNVLYDVRGPIVDAARQMEDEGQKIIKLNIGNMAPFGFDPPEEVVQDMARNLPDSAGYSDSKGIFAARKAVMHYTQQQGIAGRDAGRHLPGQRCERTHRHGNPGAAQRRRRAAAARARLSAVDGGHQPGGAGVPVHYVCDESNGWMPSLEDMRAKITPRTRGIVVINPNNPTGALYSDALLRGIVQLAREHDLVLLVDEVYDKGAVRGRKAHGHGQPVHRCAHAHLQLALQGLPFVRLPRGLDGGFGRQAGRARLHRGAEHAGQPQARLQRAGPVGHPDGAGWLPEHQRPHQGRRPPAPPARSGLRTHHGHPRCHLRQAPGRAVHVPAPGSRDVPPSRTTASSSWRCCAPRA
jgi:hypothetical protein